MDTLYKILLPIEKIPIDTESSWNFRGYFADNRNETKFYVDIDTNANSTRSKREILRLFEFIDKGIKWKVTYDLN